jgi:hypothetical protein
VGLEMRLKEAEPLFALAHEGKIEAGSFLEFASIIV